MGQDVGDTLRVDVGDALVTMMEAIHPHVSDGAWRELIEALAKVDGVAK